MRNVTISLDEDLVRKLKVEAARRDMSVSRFLAALVARELEPAADPDYQRAMRQFLGAAPFIDRGEPPVPFPTREELYDRPLVRRHERPAVQPRQG